MAGNPFRAASRAMTPARRRMTAFHGASNSRLWANWTTTNVSPDYEIQQHIRTLRARARQLVRDNAYAAGFVTELANNVVGPHGILLDPRILDVKSELDKDINAAILEGWNEWSLPENASADGHDSWSELQRLWIKMLAVDGEILIRKRRYFNNDFGFALQTLDPDQLDDTVNRLPSNGQNEIRMGVELDSDQRPVAYHLLDRHPSDQGVKRRIRVPADEIIHRFIRYRPGQTRGVTWFAPVLTSVMMLDGYTESELVAARTAAGKMGFIVDKNGVGAAPVDPNSSEEDSPRYMEADPGVIGRLGPGEEFQGFDPTHPSTAFKDFVKAILRGIARGLGISYTALTGDLESANYSSLRAGMLPERDAWRTLQIWMSTHVHRVIYREWIKMALVSQAISVPIQHSSAYLAVQWRPRGWAWVDPKKDIEARILGLDYGLDSRTDILADEGEDFEQTLKNLKEEKRLAEEYGINIMGENSKPASPSFDEDGQNGNGSNNEQDQNTSARKLRAV